MRTWLMKIGIGLALLSTQAVAGKPPLEAPRPEKKVKFYIQQGVSHSARPGNYDQDPLPPSYTRYDQANQSRRAILAREAYKARQRLMRIESRTWHGVSTDRPIYQTPETRMVTPQHFYYWHAMQIPAIGAY